MLTGTPRLRRTFLLLTICTLAVFAALLLGLTAVLRERLRGEVLNGEGEAIHAVALMQIGAAQARLDTVGVTMSTEDVFTAVLESSRLPGVLAVQLFDAAGKLQEALPDVPSDVAERSEWWPHTPRTAVVRYYRRGSLEEVFGITTGLEAGATRTPLLEVIVPLTSPNADKPLGIARYWVDGADMRAEFGRMDANLLTQAGIGFLGGGALVVLLLAWAYRRLDQTHRQLLERSADLAQANQELDFAAKTGALGAISAHLIHGLKNPLAGLEGFVAEAAANEDATLSGEARQTAVDTARRLRALVNEVVGVLRDEASGAADYRVPLREVVESVQAKTAPAASAAGVNLTVAATSDGDLSARTGNLAGLVLANLLTNAIEATRAGGSVQLEGGRNNGDIEFLVTDTGPGLPEAVRASLFRPVMSTKRGGGGMGLAISSRLARHAGGELSLVRSDANGTVFRLRVPSV